MNNRWEQLVLTKDKPKWNSSQTPMLHICSWQEA